MSKISELSDGGALQSTDYLIAVRSGGNVKVRPNGAVSGTTGQFSTSLNVDGTVTADGLTSSQAAEIFSNAFSGGETPALRLSNTSEGVGTTATLEFIAGSSDTSANTRKAVIENISTTGSGSSLHFYTTDDGTNLRKRMLIANNGDISFYEDTGTTPKFFWDASAEALGIGTTSPTVPLHIVKAASGVNQPTDVLRLSSVDTDTSYYVGFQTQRDNSAGMGLNILTTNVLGTVSEAMRITPSGNLLVGTTDASVHIGTTSGAVLRSEGFGFFAVSSNPPVYANRLIDDGAIIELRKDGAAVGSIGTLASRLFIGSDDTFLTFQGASDRIYPALSSGGVRDAAIDLGYASGRFKDLYLSGGVVFGSTGGAVTSKTLDDYEEGTFTPVLAGSSTAGAFTYALQEGRYVKVGESVHVHIAIQVTATSTSPVGDMKIYGLPFTIGPSFPSFAIGWTQYITFADQIGAYGGGTLITLRNLASGGSGSNIQGSGFASNFFIFIAGTYEAA